MNVMKSVLLAAGLSLAIGVNAAPRQFEVGMEALLSGNYAEAYCRWKPLAEKGNAQAQYHFGWLYANGNGMNVDIDTAVHWWKAAAEQRHADAQFALALAYTTSDGIGKDMDTAVDWYLTAAKQGHQDARDLLVRLNADPKLRMAEKRPDLAKQPWFGWPALVKSNRVNVRSGPSTKHKVALQLNRNDEVRVVGQRAKWLLVRIPGHENEPTWMYQTLLKPAKIDAR